MAKNRIFRLKNGLKIGYIWFEGWKMKKMKKILKIFLKNIEIFSKFFENIQKILKIFKKIPIFSIFFSKISVKKALCFWKFCPGGVGGGCGPPPMNMCVLYSSEGER